MTYLARVSIYFPRLVARRRTRCLLLCRLRNIACWVLGSESIGVSLIIGS